MTQATQHATTFEELNKVDEQARAERIADAIIQSFSAKSANDASLWRTVPLEWREILFGKNVMYVGFDYLSDGSIDIMEYQWANEEPVIGLTPNERDWVYWQVIEMLDDEHNMLAAGDNYGDWDER